MESGAKAAVEILNAEGGANGRKFELVIQAHSGTPAAAVAAATKIDSIFGNVEMRGADHHLIRQHGMAQVVKARAARMSSR